jgi:hypothetical protein
LPDVQKITIQVPTKQWSLDQLSTFDFSGPVFAYHSHPAGNVLGPELEHDAATAYDMDMRTYAHLVACLTYHHNDSFDRLKGPKVTCVKAACEGDIAKGVPSHQAVLVPRSHPVFLGKGAFSMISEVIFLTVSKMFET